MSTPTELFINAELPKRPYTNQYPLTAGHVPIATGNGLETSARQLDVTDIANAASETYVDDAIAAIHITPQFSDSELRIQDNSDATKQLAFEVSGIATGTTKTWTVPNANINFGHMYIGASYNASTDTWTYNRADGTNDQIGIGFPADGTWYIKNTTDATKKIAFNATNISSGQRRVISMPDINVDLGNTVTGVSYSGGTLSVSRASGADYTVSIPSTTREYKSTNFSAVPNGNYIIDASSITIDLPIATDGQTITLTGLVYGGATAMTFTTADNAYMTIDGGDQTAFLSPYTLQYVPKMSIVLLTSRPFAGRRGWDIKIIPTQLTSSAWFGITDTSSLQNNQVRFALSNTGSITITTPIQSVNLNSLPQYNSLNSNNNTVGCAIVCGQSNQTAGTYSFIGGGSTNLANGTYSGIVAGINNIASGSHGFVGGGLSNTASGGDSAVVGGSVCTASGLNSFVGGGSSNSASTTMSVICGGNTNSAASSYAAIVGGYANTVFAGSSGQYCFIGAGYNNRINQNSYVSTSDYSVIVGGNANKVDGMYSSILGGQSNTINTSVSDAHNAIVGGFSNTITGRKSTIVGGQSNNILGFSSSILSGVGNTITSNGDRSAIIAGGNNQVDAAGQVVITGGTANKVSAQYSSTISANTTSVVRGGGYRTIQILQGVTSSSTTIYLDVNGINSGSQLTTSAVPHTVLSGSTGEYKLARHEIVIEITGQSFGNVGIGTIISRWKNVDGTYTKLGSDTYTVEYEDGTIAGLINNMVISNNSGRLQVAAVSTSAEIIEWRAFVTSDYS